MGNMEDVSDALLITDVMNGSVTRFTLAINASTAPWPPTQSAVRWLESVRPKESRVKKLPKGVDGD